MGRGRSGGGRSGGGRSGRSGGAVHVRAYTRSDGTRVAAHTRSSPSGGGSSRSTRSSGSRSSGSRSGGSSSSGRMYVPSYTRRDGTRVRGYYRRIGGGTSSSRPRTSRRIMFHSNYHGSIMGLPSFHADFADIINPQQYRRMAMVDLIGVDPAPSENEPSNSDVDALNDRLDSLEISEPNIEFVPIVFVEQPSADVCCPICHDVFSEPVKTECNHPFCKACICEWMDAGGEKCPLDRRPIDVEKLIPDEEKQRMVNKLKIRCRYGCRSTGRDFQGNVVSDVTECVWEEDNREDCCHEVIELGKRDEHETHCKYRRRE